MGCSRLCAKKDPLTQTLSPTKPGERGLAESLRDRFARFETESSFLRKPTPLTWTLRVLQGDTDSAKFWLEPIALARNLGFSGHELRVIEKIIRDNQQELLEAWNDWFGN